VIIYTVISATDSWKGYVIGRVRLHLCNVCLSAGLLQSQLATFMETWCYYCAYTTRKNCLTFGVCERMLLLLLLLTVETMRFIHSECSGVVVEYRTRNREVAGSTHTQSTASNLKQVPNLLCVQANSASYPQRDGKWVVAQLLWDTGWRLSVANWGDGVSASCTVGPIVRYRGQWMAT